ncbi:Thiol-disulfide isomerase and thioredoxin [Flavobacterium limnosediminis JC2902]|uniref:Thiol-disulfide isomerase and thioredoxin n=1 Tax=Flavobacterium limnosediminis JC2902 TaxID=1341181 RepID=V6SQ33_9FLAO|nr:TlpA disulfide reductase family protein [Flavobacterium limnosediminis]ESU26535.1 Thiol-disulfide isomerase and thioredoxin [Flavobacterium limnosediminis JC2902]
MKNTLYLLLVVFFASFTTPKETITLSGKITNTEDGKLKIKGEAFEKEITLKADGTFSETFQIEYIGTYNFGTKANRSSLYLTKGTKLVINFDDKNFAPTLKYSGKGSAENQYLSDKSVTVNKIMGNVQEFYALDETAFLAKLKEVKTAMTDLLEKSKITDADFKKNEVKSIGYFEQLQIMNYPSYHAHYAKIEGFTPSATFPKFDEKIDLDNEGDFLFSSPYKQIVASKFSNNLHANMNENDEYTYKLALPEIKKVKSPAIRNAHIQSLSYEVGAGNPDATMLYNELMALSTDEKFKKDLTVKFDKIKTLTPGNVSPKFDYENFKGGKTSLESLKGKYVYIDVWATWCGPCRREIPNLQKVEEQFHGKNIEFVSLSIDAKKDYEKWRKFVEDKKLGGIQLFADSDWSSKFVQDYAIEGIPRFILIDPNGNIVSADAPRPSDPKLVAKFEELGIK